MKNKIVFVMGVLMFAVHLKYTFGQQNRAEQTAIAKVQSLPEVKAFITSNAKQQPQIIIAKTPDRQLKYYWIKVGLSDMGMFRSAYDFYVNPDTQKLYYVDFMVDNNSGMEIISIQKWRSVRKEPAFKQMHYYKEGNLRLKKY